jgi:hypothetical protein
MKYAHIQGLILHIIILSSCSEEDENIEILNWAFLEKEMAMLLSEGSIQTRQDVVANQGSA